VENTLKEQDSSGNEYGGYGMTVFVHGFVCGVATVYVASIVILLLAWMGAQEMATWDEEGWR
jgi:hypothetical protein